MILGKNMCFYKKKIYIYIYVSIHRKISVEFSIYVVQSIGGLNQ